MQKLLRKYAACQPTVCNALPNPSKYCVDTFTWSTETALNNTQLKILNLFSANQSEEDLKEIKSPLVAYLSDKVVREADKIADAKKYTRDL